MYKEALREGLYYLALDDDALRRRGLVAGLYQMARNKKMLGDPRMLQKLEEYQRQIKSLEEFGRLLERHRGGLESMLEGDKPEESSYIGIVPLAE